MATRLLLPVRLAHSHAETEGYFRLEDSGHLVDRLLSYRAGNTASIKPPASSSNHFYCLRIPFSHFPRTHFRCLLQEKPIKFYDRHRPLIVNQSKGGFANRREIVREPAGPPRPLIKWEDFIEL